jgi:hypothetical protein
MIAVDLDPMVETLAYFTPEQLCPAPDGVLQRRDQLREMTKNATLSEPGAFRPVARLVYPVPTAQRGDSKCHDRYSGGYPTS